MKFISFGEQFHKCSTEGFTNETVFESFEEHPELLPLFPSDKLQISIASGELKGLNRVVCGRFGGFCGSDNLECRKIRNYDFISQVDNTII